MTGLDWVLVFLFALMGWGIGVVAGSYALRCSLVLRADDPNRTPHKLGDKFYYIVPESDYCRMVTADVLRQMARKKEAESCGLSRQDTP